MTARVARGNTSGQRRPSGGVSTKKRKNAPPPGLLDGLPVSPETRRRIARWGITLFVIAFTLAFALALRLPQKIGEVTGRAIGDAGFAVSRVEVRGLNRMNRNTVYNIVLGQPSLAMPLIDLDAVRGQLMEQRWIREARVSRRLPDTLVVEIEERAPAAVWQQNGQLSLIDDTGYQIARVGPDAMPNLPLVIGPGAQHQLAGLNALLQAAPRLRPLVAGATWVGDRRWDIAFNTGEILSLPEGQEPAQAALRHFANADQENRYLGGNFMRFDMRIEGQMIVRLRNAPEEIAPAGQPAASRAAPAPAPAAPARTAPAQAERRAEPAAPSRPARPAQDLTRTI